MTCPTFNFPTNTDQDVATLTGVTGDSVTVTCAPGFVVGGGSNTVTSITFSCNGTGDATNAWGPTPSSSICLRKRPMLLLLLYCVCECGLASV